MAAECLTDLNKVSVIFEAFDCDKDARLNEAELKQLIQRCNPSILFSAVQLQAIISEVMQSRLPSTEGNVVSRYGGLRI